MKVLHSWLKDYIGDSIRSPEEIAELLTFHAFEIEGVEHTDEHTVIDVDVLANRASDCLCHRGIAREIATITGTPLAHDPLKEPVELPATDRIAVEIEDPAACPRFTATLIEGVTVQESPAWLKDRLRAIGARPINNIVDATNYVMYAIGQPLHAYDADRFPQAGGAWQFGVRMAKDGEIVGLIAESGTDAERDVTLTGAELLITEGSKNMPIGLAGVKGGRYAGVHEGTVNIIIEAAHFDPALTRKTARKLGIVIDASKRFENEPSRELPPYAQREVVELILNIAGGTCAGMIDVYPEPTAPPSVTLRPERVNALLGLSLEIEEMREILDRVGVTVASKGNALSVTGPWERTDLRIEEDFIEEIGRVHGYEDVESVSPDQVPLPEHNKRHYFSEAVRDALIEAGFSEVITSSFRKDDEVELENALASDKGCLRSSLRRNITEVLEKNMPHVDLLGTTDVRVFEIGTVFRKGPDGISEHVSLCLGVRTKQSGYSTADEKVLLEVVATVEGVLGTPLQGESSEGVYETNFSARLDTLPEPNEYRPVEITEEIQFRPFSQLPHVSRDIALWVPEGTTALEVEAILNEYAGPLRVRTTLFDEYHKDDRISYAFRLVFQSEQKTLTDFEVNEIMDDVYAAVKKKKWEVR